MVVPYEVVGKRVLGPVVVQAKRLIGVERNVPRAQVETRLDGIADGNARRKRLLRLEVRHDGVLY